MVGGRDPEPPVHRAGSASGGGGIGRGRHRVGPASGTDRARDDAVGPPARLSPVVARRWSSPPAGRRRPCHRYTRRAMTHVFVAPHPDDVALSCGGLIASLRELGQNVTILTVFSGNGAAAGLTDYQREALGFGSKAIWPTTEAFNRANIAADRPLGDERALPRATRGSSTPPRPRPTRPPSASGSARRGTGARTSTTGPWPASRWRTTCPSRARSSPPSSSRRRWPAT